MKDKAPLATALSDVFAVGDMRLGSVRRVASGVREKPVISAVHQVPQVLDIA